MLMTWSLTSKRPKIGLTCCYCFSPRLFDIVERLEWFRLFEGSPASTCVATDQLCSVDVVVDDEMNWRIPFGGLCRVKCIVNRTKTLCNGQHQYATDVAGTRCVIVNFVKCLRGTFRAWQLSVVERMPSRCLQALPGLKKKFRSHVACPRL